MTASMVNVCFPHRSSLLLLGSAVLTLVGIPLAHARDICSVSEDPDFENGSIKLECSSGQTFQEYFEDSICGGFDKEISVLGGAPEKDPNKPPKRSGVNALGKPGYIQKVTGVPGRYGDPLGEIFSGMAKRIETGGDKNDGFQFPDNTVGISTTAVPGSPKTTKNVFHCSDNSRITAGQTCDKGLGLRSPEEYGYPYFKDPPCRWRLQDDENGNAKPKEDPPPYTEGDFKEEDQVKGQTPELCTEFKDYLNAWQYWDCVASEENLDPDRHEGEDLICHCYGMRYITNDQVVLGSVTCDEVGQVAQDNDLPNAKDCQGKECRCSLPGTEQWCVRSKDPPDGVGELNGTADLPYRSYYRKYDASFEREKLSRVGEDDASKSGPIACYGFYNEFDTKKQRTQTDDRRCVINIDVSDMDTSQQGKGDFAVKDVKDVGSPQAKQFDKNKDSWWQVFAGGFSLLSPKQKDLSLALSDVQTAKIQTVPQVSMENNGNGWAPGSLVRDFDDTGPLRTIVRWWHNQETAANALFTPPALRLVHVPAWVLGLDPKNPLFLQASSSSAPRTLADGKREQTIDLQANVQEDIVGQVLNYLDTTVLAVQEEPLPVVVPLGAPGEFRARAQSLCGWYIAMKNNQEKDDTKKIHDCNAADGSVGDTIKKLSQYADQEEKVRVLRGQLASFAGEILEGQANFLKPLHDWNKKNLETYKEYLQKREKILAMQAQWKTVASHFSTFHEQTNVPWCMNQRYTTAIYSLLDPWMPTRSQGGNAYERVSAQGNNPGDQPEPGAAQALLGLFGSGEPIPSAKDLPSLTNIPVYPQPDLTFDLSVFQQIRSPFKLPVLKPIQVLVDMQPYAPPGIDDINHVFPPLPDLPSYSDAQKVMDDARASLPTFCSPTPTGSGATVPQSGSGKVKRACPEVTAPPAAQMPTLWTDEEQGKIALTMNEIDMMIVGMDNAYKNFWDGLNPKKDENPELEEKKQKLKCPNWGVLPCEYTEMELIEELTRIGARPAVALKEDYDSVGTLRGVGGVCLPDDDACHLLNPQWVYPRTGWQVKSGSGSVSSAPLKQGEKAPVTIDELRQRLMKLSLPKPIGNESVDKMIPLTVPPAQLQPGLEVPGITDLSVSSSNTSATGAP